MASVTITASQSVERVMHCIFCNEQASQTAPLTLRYFAEGSFVAKLLSPLIHRRHLIYLLSISCLIIAFASAILLLLLLRTRIGGGTTELVIYASCFSLSYLVPKAIAKAPPSMFWKTFRTAKREMQSPVCSKHFAATDLDFLDPSRGPKLTAMRSSYVGLSFLCLYGIAAYLEPTDWLDQLAIVGIAVVSLFVFFIAWAVMCYQMRRSRRYLTGFTNDNRDQFEILNCSESFATEASMAKVLLETTSL